MASVADFAPFVEIKVRHAPTPNIHHAVRESLIAFMRMSRAAVDEVYVDVPRGETEIVVEPRGCQRLLQVEGVYEDPYCQQGGRWTPEWERIAQEGAYGRGFAGGATTRGSGWSLDDVGGPNATMWLYPKASKPRRLCIRYSWSIKRDDCTVPEWIYEDYADVIADGAIALLHLNPTDEDVSVSFGNAMSQAFLDGVAAARRRKEGGYRQSAVSMVNTGFFRG